MLRSELSAALRGRNPTPALEQLRGFGHRIRSEEVIVGPFRVRTRRYWLDHDATPALFPIWETDPR